MNQAFLFELETYKPSTGETRHGQRIKTGSQETRARRRLLLELHRNGWFAKTIKLISSRPAHLD